MKKRMLWVIAAVAIAIVFVAVFVAGRLSSDGLQSTGMREYDADDFAMRAPSVEGAKIRQEMAPGSPVGSIADVGGADAPQQRIVIRSAQLSIVAQDVQAVTDALKDFAQKNGGFVVSADVETGEGYPPTADVTLRVPADRLDQAVAFVKKQALRVASESVTGEDVTEEYVDIGARLGNLGASETQLLAIMKDARKTEDVLSVHREIERVRGEIDVLAGRKKYLEQSAKLSSVSVSVATDEASLPVVESGDEWRPVVVAKEAVAAFVDLLKFLANLAIWVVVFVPVWGTAILVVRRWKRSQ